MTLLCVHQFGDPRYPSITMSPLFSRANAPRLTKQEPCKHQACGQIAFRERGFKRKSADSGNASKVVRPVIADFIEHQAHVLEQCFIGLQEGAPQGRPTSLADVSFVAPTCVRSCKGKGGPPMALNALRYCTCVSVCVREGLMRFPCNFPNVFLHVSGVPLSHPHIVLPLTDAR